MTWERITSRKNPLLQHVRKLLAARDYRDACGEYAADGTKLLEEAAKWESGLHTVIAAEGTRLCPLPEGIRVVQVPPDVMESVSQMRSPQGALFLCRKPAPPALSLGGGALILDGIQDPGNLGTILRTADALEVPAVLTGDCADPYNPKTVRAAMGAVFRSPPVCSERRAVAAACAESGVSLAAAVLTPAAENLRTADLRRTAVIIGSEGMGISEEFLSLSQRRLFIPMHERCESLNAAAAAAIILWQMRGEAPAAG